MTLDYYRIFVGLSFENDESDYCSTVLVDVAAAKGRVLKLASTGSRSEVTILKGGLMVFNSGIYITILSVLVGGSAFAKEASKREVASTGQTITCGDLKFKPPAKMGDLPTVEFAYPVSVVRFSFRDGNLELVAMDKDDNSRPRIFISAQLNSKSHQYVGQIFRDNGGNEIQTDNGPITCSLN